VVAIREYYDLCLGALFFKEEVFERMRDDPHRLRKGLALILVVGVVIIPITLLASLIKWGMTPDPASIAKGFVDAMGQIEWLKSVASQPKFIEDLQSRIASAYGVNIVAVVLFAMVNPIILVLRWLIYGIFAFIFARMLGSKGTLSQTLGCTALAVAPSIILSVQAIAFGQSFGLDIWGWICSYLAVKVSNQLSPARAFWSTVLPPIASVLIFIGFICIGTTLIGLGGKR
jgi:hypothetical protein